MQTRAPMGDLFSLFGYLLRCDVTEMFKSEMAHVVVRSFKEVCDGLVLDGDILQFGKNSATCVCAYESVWPVCSKWNGAISNLRCFPKRPTRRGDTDDPPLEGKP